MSATAQMTRMRMLLSQSPMRQTMVRSTPLRASIRHHHNFGRTAVAVAAPQAANRYRPWLMASVTTAGVISWQIGHSLVESEAPPQVNTVIDPDSKTAFPLTIKSEDGSPARLLGLGVRKITFLKIQVYVVGLYAKASDLDDHNSRFRALPEVQKFQRSDMDSSDTAFKAIVQTPIELILRIAPVRNTNGPHLRDGFTRNLTQAAKDQKLSDPELEEAMDGIMQFKNLFPKGKINVGQALLFRKSPDGSMTIQLDEEELGSIRNNWLIETFFLGYLHGEKPISEKARESIAKGVQDLLLD